MERALKKRMYIYTGVLLVSIIAAVAVITIYYEYRLRYMVTSLYGQDSQAGKQLLYILFYGTHGNIPVSDYPKVLQEAGYTTNGAWYMFLYGKVYIPFLIVGVIVVFVIVLAIYNIVKIGHDDIYSYAKELKETNENLSQELAAYKSYMEKRNKQLQDYTENIAHQIKTPLTALSLSLDMMGETIGDSADRQNNNTIMNTLSDNLNECFRQTYRIRDFIVRLLKLSRMESGKIVFTKDDINVGVFLEEVVSKVPVNNDGRTQCVITTDCDDADYCINADEQWLSEALINIIQNCSEEAEHVDITAVCNRDKCIITIKDDGKGIDKDKIENVFNRFESGKSYDSMHAGIGLNLSKLIIEAHHNNAGLYPLLILPRTQE
jgi:signal transduction histidine kinase